MTEFMSVHLLDIIFYVAPFVFVAGGFVMGWTLKTLRYEKKEDQND